MESAALLGNLSPTNNYLMEKVFFGLSILGGIGFSTYHGVSLTQNLPSEASKWVALGASVAMVGVSLFGLIHAFKHSQIQIQSLENVVIDITEPKSNSELTQIHKKINTILGVMQLKNQIRLDYSEQEILEVSQILNQLDFLNDHLKSQNSTIQNFEKNKSTKELAQSNEIDRLTNLLLEKENQSKEWTKKLEFANGKEQSQSKEVTRLINLIEKTKKESNEKIEEKKEKLENANDKIATLELTTQFYKNQFTEILLNLGSPLDPIVADDVEKTRKHIASILKDASISGYSTVSNSTASSIANTPCSTPNTTPIKDRTNNS